MILLGFKNLMISFFRVCRIRSVRSRIHSHIRSRIHIRGGVGLRR